MIRHSNSNLFTTESALSRFGLMLALAALLGGSVEAQKFYPDDPLWTDDDQLPIEKPQAFDASKLFDFLEKTFRYKPGAYSLATNINTLGEVPDSSWFTNRIGRRSMSLDELRRGSSQGQGPDVQDRPLAITSLKMTGVTPGFVFRDGRGDLYFSKVDPLDYPQMGTSAEVISSKFLHAFGYNVPENYLTFVRPQQFFVPGDATIQGRSGKVTVIRQARLQAMLKNVPRRADGTIQIMASKRVAGESLGPFDFLGTRADDANDIHRHEHRRELRGYRLMTAWINHNDSDSANTLDVFLRTDQDRGFVKHYLIDFGTTLGSGAVEPHQPRAGYEYYYEGRPLLKSLLTLGLSTRPWQRIDYPDLPSVGHFEADVFHPRDWRPDYPNPAFLNMGNDDAFWAAKIIQRFSDETVRAMVSEGRLEDPAAEQYLVESLIRRRDKIVRYYMSLINPLDEFAIESGTPRELVFANLGIRAGLAAAADYRFRWFDFDNLTEKAAPLGAPGTTGQARIAVPDSAGAFLLVEIETLSDDQPDWQKKVRVYLRNGAATSVVGIEREN